MSIITTHDFYPDGNVRTDPQHLSDRQKEQARRNIGAAAQSEIGGGSLTPEQAQKLSEIDSKLDRSQLQEVINQALQQAKESGQFDGQTPQLSIGTVATLEPGAEATAEITGTAENLRLNLGIPAGKNPVRGVDYWTASDQQSIVRDTLEALPKWTGGAF